MNQWVADVEPSGLRVSFTATGSAQGRTDFANSVSDIAYQGTDLNTGVQDTSSRPYAYLPRAGNAMQAASVTTRGISQFGSARNAFASTARGPGTPGIYGVLSLRAPTSTRPGQHTATVTFTVV